MSETPEVQPEPEEVETPETVVGDVVDYDAEDVPAALARETEDGPGDLNNMPGGDFDGFPEEDVEEEQ